MSNNLSNVTPTFHSYKPSRRLVVSLIAAFVFLFIAGITFIVWCSNSTFEDTEDFFSSSTDLSPLFIKELVPIGNDNQKISYLGRAEISLIQAELLQQEKNYPAAHRCYAEANESLLVAFGDSKSAFLNIFLIREAKFEQDFKKWKESEVLLRRALKGLAENSPTEATVFVAKNMLGEALERQHRYPEAIKEFKEVVVMATAYDAKSKSRSKSATASIWSRSWLSSCYCSAEQFENMIATSEEIIAFAKKKGDKNVQVENLILIGSAWGRLEQDDKAISAYDAALAIDPVNTKAMHYLAEIYDNEKLYPQALAVINRAIELNPKMDELWEYRAEIYYATGKLELAISDLDKAIKLNDTSIERFKRASCLRKLGRDKEALLEYTNLLIENKKDPWAYFCRGEVYQKSKQHELAISDFSNALVRIRLMKTGDESYYDGDSAKPEAVIYRRRAASYEAFGKKDLAASDLRSAAKVDSEAKQIKPVDK